MWWMWNSLGDNKITCNGTSLLFESLLKNRIKINKINIYANQINDDCMEMIGEYVKFNKDLSVLGLSYNHITDNGIEILSPFLIGLTSLRSFKLSGNKGITNESIPILINILQNSFIDDLVVQDTSIDRKYMLYVPIAINEIKNHSRELDLKDL